MSARSSAQARRCALAARGIVALLALPLQSLAAQEIPEFHKLRTPTSPAFVILGIAPAEIQRPTSPATFATSFLQSAEEATEGLPNKYAVEVAPYWLVPHPRLTFREYQAPTWRSLYRDATISLGITDSLGDGEGPAADDPNLRRLGVGVRAPLYRSRVPAAATACVQEVSAAATDAATILGRMVADSLAAGTLNPADPAALDAFQARNWPRALAALTAAQKAVLESRTQECAALLAAREGFALEFAAATALSFPGGRAGDGEVSSVGLWLTPAFLGQSFSNIGVLRARWDALDTDEESLVLDAGFRSIYAWRRFATSVEGVLRSEDRNDVRDEMVRMSIVFDAQLTRQTWLTVTLGKDFESDERNSLLALLGLQWQLGERSIQPDRPTP